MSRIERQSIQRDHSFFATQAMILFYGLRLLADLRIFIPKDIRYIEHEHLGTASHSSRLPVVLSDSTGTTILVKSGEGIRLKTIDDEGIKDYLIHDYRRKRNSVTGILNEAYGLIKHSGKLRKEKGRYRINAGKTKTIRQNKSGTIDRIEITHFKS